MAIDQLQSVLCPASLKIFYKIASIEGKKNYLYKSIVSEASNGMPRRVLHLQEKIKGGKAEGGFRQLAGFEMGFCAGVFTCFPIQVLVPI